MEKYQHLTKPSNGRLFRRLLCGLTLRYHKKINYKAAIYGGVKAPKFKVLLKVRRFKNISKSKQDTLRDQFSHIYSLYRADEEGELKQISVSVFDHWLRGNEIETELSDVPPVLQVERDSKLHRFSCLLAEKTDAYLVQLKGIRKRTLVFKQFTDEEGKRETLKPLAYNYGSKGRFVLALPKLKVLYFEWWDFTHHFYYGHNGDLGPIREAAESCDLYLL